MVDESMRTHEFKTHSDYVDAQIDLTRRKVSWGKSRKSARKFMSVAVVQRISHHYHIREGFPKFGICHGVRYGDEVELFRGWMQGEWIGTEICSDLCDGKQIICHDFSIAKDEWLNLVDVIYSNSLDHARDPEETLKVWLACLSPTGRVYIEWNKYHNKLGRGRNKADCFAASAEEYVKMLGKVGNVETILDVDVRPPRKIFVVCK